MSDWLRAESERMIKEGEGIRIESLEDFIQKILEDPDSRLEIILKLGAATTREEIHEALKGISRKELAELGIV